MHLLKLQTSHNQLQMQNNQNMYLITPFALRGPDVARIRVQWRPSRGGLVTGPPADAIISTTFYIKSKQVRLPLSHVFHLFL